MTYAEALARGYKNGDRRVQAGYISRGIVPEKQPVLTARGKRAGQLYVEIPNFESTSYGVIRQYLIAPE